MKHLVARNCRLVTARLAGYYDAVLLLKVWFGMGYSGYSVYYLLLKLEVPPQCFKSIPLSVVVDKPFVVLLHVFTGLEFSKVLKSLLWWDV